MFTFISISVLPRGHNIYVCLYFVLSACDLESILIIGDNLGDVTVSMFCVFDVYMCM